VVAAGDLLDAVAAGGAGDDAVLRLVLRQARVRLSLAHLALVLIGVLTSCGVYLLLERNLTRMLLGLLLIGNAVNLLILTVGGPSGNPPIDSHTSAGRTTTADPLVQGMILTAIVITMKVCRLTRSATRPNGTAISAAHPAADAEIRTWREAWRRSRGMPRRSGAMSMSRPRGAATRTQKSTMNGRLGGSPLRSRTEPTNLEDSTDPTPSTRPPT